LSTAPKPPSAGCHFIGALNSFGTRDTHGGCLDGSSGG
jgi:hypothetical protein